MNPHRIAAVLRLTWHDAIRSRVVVSLLVALLLVLVGLPLLVQGDGTPAGRLRVLLEYALAAAVGLLSAATLWAGCASMAVEMEDRRLFVVLAKPIHRWELWLGKWLGIVMLDGLALVVTGLVVAVSIACVRPAGHDARVDALLCARETLHPVAPETSGSSSGGAPGTPSTPARRALTVDPGQAVDLRFPPSPAPVSQAPLELRTRLGSSRPERSALETRWIAGPPETPVAVIDATNFPGLPIALELPATACGADGVRLRFVNTERRYPATVIIAPEAGGLELLVPRDGFPVNLVRSLLVIWARLAFLAALGVAAGSLLSLPVAVFVSVFFLVLLAMAGYVETVAATGVFYVPHEGEPEPPTWVDRGVLHVFKAMHVVTEPLVRFDPVPLLADGRRVSWPMVLEAGGTLGVGYVSVVALLGLWRFTRREVGLSGAE